MTPHRERRPRREPRQERSRAMVERIVAAGQTVLVARGYEGASTNHIASVAGISPGSLYQYFPDKEAILTLVLERYTDALQARISHAFLDALRNPSVTDSVRDSLIAILDAFEESPDLLRVLLERTPRTADARIGDFARRIDELVTTVLTLGRPRSAELPADAIAWVLVRTVQHVTSSYVLERPAIAREAVVEELTTLIAGYLSSRAPLSPRRSR